MTKPLPPEIKALRAIERALDSLDPSARLATIDWLFAREHKTTQAEVAKRFTLWPLFEDRPERSS